MVVLKETPEPCNLPAPFAQKPVRSQLQNNDPVATYGRDRKQWETSYIHPVAFNTNLIPLATRDLRSPSMDSGDYAC